MIQLGYTFNPTLIKKIGLSSLRLYANVNNAFLITSKDYNGYDPDNSSRLGDNKWGLTASSLPIRVRERLRSVLM